jgi:transcriptional regulator with XRE-family HTH domain
MSGDELRFQRKRIGLKPEDIARFAGVGVRTVERWELDGSSVPHALRLRVLLTELELKRREVLATAADPEHWNNWLAQHLTEKMTGDPTP